MLTSLLALQSRGTERKPGRDTLNVDERFIMTQPEGVVKLHIKQCNPNAVRTQKGMM